jgi:hypothetical protein
MSVLYGRADDRLAVPFAAWLGALDGGLATRTADELAEGLGEHAGVLASLVPRLRSALAIDQEPAVVEPPRLEPAILAALRLLGAPTGALLVLDDMQWASRAELDVLEALLADPEHLAVLVLVLHRGPEAAKRSSSRKPGAPSSTRPGPLGCALQAASAVRWQSPGDAAGNRPLAGHEQPFLPVRGRGLEPRPPDKRSLDVRANRSLCKA